MSSNKKLFIQTLGCQMNDTDSQHIQAELEKHKGYTATQSIEERLHTQRLHTKRLHTQEIAHAKFAHANIARAKIAHANMHTQRLHTQKMHTQQNDVLI